MAVYHNQKRFNPERVHVLEKACTSNKAALKKNTFNTFKRIASR